MAKHTLKTCAIDNARSESMFGHISALFFFLFFIGLRIFFWPKKGEKKERKIYVLPFFIPFDWKLATIYATIKEWWGDE